MNNQHVKGKVNEIKGKVKEEVGYRTGNNETAGRGVADQIKGKIQTGLGDLKEAVKKGVDTVLHHDKRKAS